MTTSRIVRGTKGRIFMFICAILVLTGIIAFYNNSRIELENAKKSNDLCQQQQENLSTQLQVISDYKQRLEKSLKTEKAEHQQTKTELESRLNEDKLKYDKNTEEASIKFNTVQQHYNLLKIKHNDFIEECSKKQMEQLNIINDVQAKLKEVREQLKQAEREKENSLAHLRNLIEQLKSEKLNLERDVQELKNKKDDFKIIKLKEEAEKHILRRPVHLDVLQPPNVIQNASAKPNYSKQVPVASQEYKVVLDKQHEQNISKKLDIDEKNNQDQVVLQSPEKQPSSSTSKPLKGSSKASLELAPPLKVPTMTPETLKNKTSSVKPPEPIAMPSKSLPQGVVAMQMLPEDDKGPSSRGDTEIANLVNNRYRNVADNTIDKERSVQENILDPQERENGAHEVFDVGLNEDSNNIVGKHDEIKNHLEEYDQFQQNDANLDENEDDEADEYPHNHLPKEAAIRN